MCAGSNPAEGTLNATAGVGSSETRFSGHDHGVITDDTAPGEDARSPERDASWRDRAARLRTDAEQRVDRLRRTVGPIDVGWTAVERDNEVGGFVMAGAIAFRLFVYLLPLYLLVLVIAGAALSFDPAGPDSLADAAGMSRYVASTLSDAAATSKRSLWILIPVSLYALVSAGRSAHKVLATAHARAWGLPVTPRTKPHLAAGGFLAFSLIAAAGIFTFRRFHGGLLTPVTMVVATAYYTAMWLAVSRSLPRSPEVPVRSLLPGALLVGFGTQGLYLFNVLYLNRKIASSTAAYGALGIAASGLLWLYLLGRLMVAAPVLNATMFQRGQRPDDTASSTLRSR